MLKSINKYALYEAVNEFVLPEGSKVISAGCQNDTVMIWVLVPEVYKKSHTFKVLSVGTGWQLDLDEGVEFIGTVQMPDGLVWHIFARNKGA
ncbi:hypothetical protein [Ferrovum sp.]|uniref:DUF7352 domain-containing protein n=1 Tax=Ferrovum sp. TaxID=2609467 RepID=UPI0026284614|nr:hypothetical protein [Ferrovum sp.]